MTGNGCLPPPHAAFIAWLSDVAPGPPESVPGQADLLALYPFAFAGLIVFAAF